ncbi:MAG: hypothetical protein AB7O47_08755 [Flavobacteriales bacterium]
MSNPVFSFSFKLLILLFIVFLAHLGVLYLYDLPLLSNFIIAAYLSNYLIAIIVYAFLYKFRVRLATSLGFLFMGGSMIKFAVFFIFFLPYYKQDGDMSKIEFSSFFIPYAISLSLETFSFIKVLQN